MFQVFGDSHYAALKLDGNFYAEQFPVFELETPAGSAKKAKAACARLALEYLAVSIAAGTPALAIY